jgi:predicted Fe-Mo cluster-binding NifX family protein
MKVAVTVWEDRISPVFDASRHLLIAEMENGRITYQSNLIFDPDQPAHLANTLDHLEIPALICGAISQVPANIITAGGTTLISFITGDVNRVLKAYARGQSLVPDFVMPGCKDVAKSVGSPVRKSQRG